MTLEQLEIFLELAKTGSMTVSADNLSMTKPNVSKSINNLESELNVVLFFRTTKGSVLTPIGELFREHAVEVLTHIREMTKIALDIAPQQQISMAFSDGNSRFIYDYSQIISSQCASSSIKFLAFECDHLKKHILEINADIVCLPFYEHELHQLKTYKDSYYTYQINKSPIGVLISKKYFDQFFSSNQKYCSISTLGKLDMIVFSEFNDTSTPIGNFFQDFIKENDLYINSKIIYSNSIFFIEKYIEEHPSFLLADQFSLENSSMLSTDKQVLMPLKPTNMVYQVLLIKKNSSNLKLLSDAMFIFCNDKKLNLLLI